MLKKYSWPRTLSQGMSGADVTELQIRVAGWAADSIAQTYVAVDSHFGPQTVAAVKRFQTAYGATSENGVVGPETQRLLNSLEKEDGSTLHLSWNEFHCKDCAGFNGGKVNASEVQENIRRLMYKLEALRKKAGNHPMTIVSGFRCRHHNDQVGGAKNSQHLYGDAADISIGSLKCTELAPIAASCGFSGIEPCYLMHNGPIHVDNRVEHPSYGSAHWWWPSDWKQGDWLHGSV